MKFSVVIPLYNGAAFIEATLDTVLAQTYKDYEIILVNDESPDNVGEIVKKYISLHPNTKFGYVEQKNKGLGGARNTAIRHSSGEIIAILDQDDVWYPEKLKRVAKIYEENAEMAVVCHDVNIRRNGKVVDVFTGGPYEKDMHRALLFPGNRLFTPGVTFKKAVVEDVGYFSEDLDKHHLCEDYELWLRIALAGYKFYFIHDALGEYIIHGGNLTLSNYRCIINSELNVVSLHYGLLKNKQSLDRYRFQHRKAKLFCAMTYKLFFVSHSFSESILYFIKSIRRNPLIPLALIGISLRRIYKIITPKTRRRNPFLFK